MNKKTFIRKCANCRFVSHLNSVGAQLVSPYCMMTNRTVDPRRHVCTHYDKRPGNGIPPRTTPLRFQKFRPFSGSKKRRSSKMLYAREEFSIFVKDGFTFGKASKDAKRRLAERRSYTCVRFS